MRTMQITVNVPENPVQVQSQSAVDLEVIPLLRDDPEAMLLLRRLKDRGYTGEDVRRAMGELEPVTLPTTAPAPAKN